MRILIVQESDWLKRNMHQQHHLAELMSLRGHKIRIIDFEITWKENRIKELVSKRFVDKNVRKIYNNASVELIRPSIVKLPLLDYTSLLVSHNREIKKQIKEFKPDIVVGLGILNAYLAVKLCNEYHISFVYYWIDVLHELLPFEPLKFIAKHFEIYTLVHSDRVVAINKRLGNYLYQWSDIIPRIITAGVNKEKFNYSISGKEIRNIYKFKDDDIVLFFMGWLYKFSGLKEVVMELLYNNSNVKLMIIGDGDIYKDLIALRDKYSLQNRVIMLGKKPYSEIPSYIAASDICILPSYPKHKVMQNIVPIKMYEYMAMGKPIISTKIPAIMDEFGDKINYVSEPKDIVIQALKIKNREVEYDVMSWNEITNDFENLLKELV